MTESDAPSGKPQSYTRKTLGDSDDKPKAPEIYKWKLVKLKENGMIKFETADEKLIDLKIQDYKIVDDFHSSFLVLDHIHHAVEI